MHINRYKLIIPVSPDSINKVFAYGAQERDITALKRKWERIAVAFITDAIEEGALPDKFKGRVAFRFWLYFEHKRTRDGDNYAAMCKGIVDAFTAMQLIPDDNSEFVDDDGRRLRIDRERPRVEVSIKEKLNDEDVVDIDYAIANLTRPKPKQVQPQDDTEPAQSGRPENEVRLLPDTPESPAPEAAGNGGRDRGEHVNAA